jgi:excisionase family DNA binding protein
MSTAEQVEKSSIEVLWLTYPEAQKLSGLGRTTLWTLINSGDVKAARIGRAVRISRRSLEAYLERASEG